jgi:two-component system, NtrC family, sensor kinase
MNRTGNALEGCQSHLAQLQDTCDKQRALAELQNRLLAIFEGVETGIFIIDPENHRIVDTNPIALEMVGMSREDVVGAVCHRFVCPAQAGHCPVTDLKQAVDNSERILLTATGEQRAIIKTVRPITISGRPHLLESFLDITERKRAEASLRESEDRFRTAFEEAPNGMCMTALDGRFLHANAALCQLLGYSSEELQAGAWQQITHPEDLANSCETADRFRRGEATTLDLEKRYIHKLGNVVWARLRISALCDSFGRPSHFITHIDDITERKRAEEALRQSEVRYRELFENATDIVYTTDLEGGFTSLNRAGQESFAYSLDEAIQLTIWQVVAPSSWETVRQARARLLAGEQHVKVEVETVSKDGRRLLLEVMPRLIFKDGSPIGVQGISRDVTRRHHAEMELRNAQKLESVGRLAAGIAHEINTPVQFIGDNVRFLRDSFASIQSILACYRELRDAAASSQTAPELLAEVHRAEEESDCAYLLKEIPTALTQTLDGVERVATIVRAMKEFAHPEDKEMAAADLNRALQSTMTVARNELKYVADLESDFGELPLVVCNVSDLNQVFLNLLVNAAHAIADVVKDGEKGRITVHTASEGNMVLISISDTGCGIPEAIRSKIYDPFFTTKEVGRGTGQGLAIARSVIVKRHKGTLTFDSEIGKGTTFYIRLPVKQQGKS